MPWALVALGGITASTGALTGLATNTDVASNIEQARIVCCRWGSLPERTSQPECHLAHDGEIVHQGVFGIGPWRLKERRALQRGRLDSVNCGPDREAGLLRSVRAARLRPCGDRFGGHICSPDLAPQRERTSHRPDD